MNFPESRWKPAKQKSWWPLWMIAGAIFAIGVTLFMGAQDAGVIR